MGVSRMSIDINKEFIKCLKVNCHFESAKDLAIKALEQQQAEIEQLKKDSYGVCEWLIDDDDDNCYDTSCREYFIILDGTPEDNCFNHCVYCGGKIETPKPPEGEE